MGGAMRGEPRVAGLMVLPGPCFLPRAASPCSRPHIPRLHCAAAGRKAACTEQAQGIWLCSHEVCRHRGKRER